MGCKNSLFEEMQKHPQFPEWSEKFAALQLTPSEVFRLYQVFHRADLDGGGTIDIDELIAVVDVEKTPFTKRVFSIFDEDDSGEIDFGEFVLALWNYCTLSKVTLGKKRLFLTSI
jgi:Ca2+-binding EF-hand superfamily protein